VVIFAPLFEECFFRGFLFAGFLHSRMGVIGAVAVTSVTFAALHFQYDLYGMASILVMGIVLGIVRWRTGSLWSTILLHSLWNLTGIIQTALYVNGVAQQSERKSRYRSVKYKAAFEQVSVNVIRVDSSGNKFLVK
jgi:membrane protease YdiL (CAAX protease family)